MKVSHPDTRKKMTMKEFAGLVGVPYKTFYYRLAHGYSLKDASLLTEAEARRAALIVHGRWGTPEHTAWESMIQRCRAHPHYVLRGITVCGRWLSFENFYADMGPRPDGMSLDRIEGQKGYEPGNCRWATRIQQARNVSRNVFVLGAEGNTTVAEVAQTYGVPYGRALYRAKRGQLLVEVIRPETWGRVRAKGEKK